MKRKRQLAFPLFLFLLSCKCENNQYLKCYYFPFLLVAETEKIASIL